MDINTTPTAAAANVVSLDQARCDRDRRLQAPRLHEIANDFPVGSDDYEFWRAVARSDSPAIQYYHARLEARYA